MRTINLTATLLSASFISLGLSKVCPPLGRVLPAPHTPSENQAVKGAIETLKASLDGIFSSKLANSGVSIAVKSIHEDSLLFNHHFTPSNMSGIGTNMIDEHTIYRVGSISKMMPALAALQNSKINMDDSVLDYLPDLKSRFDAHESIYSIPWEDITVSSLASHLSGIATDSKFSIS
jgi:CubicO group peptidase (beta-lactamase class C family)